MHTDQPSGKGEQLLGIVKAYEAFGDHRTGTDVDKSTAAWLADRMLGLGGSVQRQGFEFERFDGEASIEVQGAILAALPLFSAGTGTLVTARFKTIAIDVDLWDDTQDYVSVFERACHDVVVQGLDALVVATRSATGDLIALNCSDRQRFDVPILLIAGRDFTTVAGGGVLTMSTKRTTATSENIIAIFDDDCHAERVLLTTPTTGWFRCAGERGAGIALLLELAQWLAEQCALTVIATSGHEIGHLGGSLAVASQPDGFSKVIHLGSCLASASDTSPPITGRQVGFRTLLRTDGRKAKRIAQLHSRGGMDFRNVEPGASKDRWQGESRLWADKTNEMISFAGVSHLFHTIHDRAELATSPVLLEQAFQLIRASLQELWSDR